MALGFHATRPHVAKNVIVGLDFDGTIAIGAPLRVWYARQFYGVNLTVQQILGETWPKELGKEKYRKLKQYQPVPHCRHRQQPQP